MENAFLVHQPDKIIKFEHTPEGLYTYRVDKDYKKSLKEKGSSNLVATLSENWKGYTDRQYDRAKTAQRGAVPHHQLGCQQWRTSKHYYT